MEDAQPNNRSIIFDISIYATTVIGLLVLLASYLYSGAVHISLWILGVMVYIGFALPRWIGSDKRKELAHKAMSEEKREWGFHARDREGAWINYIDFPLIKQTPVALGKYFYSKWLVIHDGYIIVNPGVSEANLAQRRVTYRPEQRTTYAWDGCNPKRLFYWIALLGTPDWWEKSKTIKGLGFDGQPTDKTVFWCQAHYASLVHDACYQYLGRIPLAKSDVDQLFYDSLLESGMWQPLARLYHWAVDKFGATKYKSLPCAENSAATVGGFDFLPIRPTGRV